jgi:glutamine---fructose-6-phosphate transaminase (isomerizing)
MCEVLMAGYVAEQASALRRLVETAGYSGLAEASERLAQAAPRKVWFAGSGTSLYASMVAARYWRDLAGVDAEAISSLELLNDVPDWQLGPGTAVVAVSQSGSTVVLAEALERARRLGSHTVAVTAESASDLALVAGDTALSLTGPEEVFAKTKGFTTTALAACLLGQALCTSRLTPAALASVEKGLALLPDMADRVAQLAVRVGADLAARFAGVGALFVVGSGPMLPAVYEGSLKLLEVAKLPVIGRDLEEVLHGYFNAIGTETGIVLLARQLPQMAKLRSFLEAAAHVGAPVAIIAEGDLAGIEADLTIPENPCEQLAPLLGIIPLQVLSYELALVRGKDPNRTRYPELYSVMKTKSIYR